MGKEVTLLPRHWDWLSTQPGGASVALRKLVQEARRANQGKDRVRQSREAGYRFILDCQLRDEGLVRPAAQTGA